MRRGPSLRSHSCRVNRLTLSPPGAGAGLRVRPFPNLRRWRVAPARVARAASGRRASLGALASIDFLSIGHSSLGQLVGAATLVGALAALLQVWTSTRSERRRTRPVV